MAQINTTVGDLSGNSRKILEYIQRAQKQDADMVIFPELAICGYPPEDLLYKEQFVEDNIQALNAILPKTTGLTAVIGFADRDKQGRLYNAAAVAAQGRIKGIYRKHNLPNYGVFDEKRYFVEGQNSPVFKFNKTLLAVNICEDIWVPDGVCQSQVKAGAKVLINLSASPFDSGKLAAREKILISLAKKQRVFVCYVNLVGGQDELVFDGGSMVIDPRGKVMAFGRPFAEDLLMADLDIPSSRKKSGRAIVISGSWQQSKVPVKPAIAERLPEPQRIYRALVLGTRDYLFKNGFKKAVIGLSGGVDSSLVACVAREALGEQNVIGISMPSQFNSAGTRNDARQLAKNLGIQFYEIPIEEIFKSYLAALTEPFQGQKFDTTEENLQARIRGNILMAFSNKFGWLVLTTGNKSEVAVGYCTLYGDMSGGFAVIKDVPKTKVYEIAKFINKKEVGLIPESVLTRPPTAELRENQKDQDSLPPYDLLDAILKSYVEDHQSLGSMRKEFNQPGIVEQVVRLVDGSEYKRRQAPPGIKITPRAFGKDWRLPITNKYKPLA